MRRLLRRTLAALAVVAVVAVALMLSSAPTSGQTGPRVTLDRTEVRPGETVLVSFQGFESQFVNIVLCGNFGYRGARDCNVTAGVSKETLAGGRVKLVQLIAHAPPAHCPCLVKATASSGGDFAVAPIVLTGHPVGSIVGVSDGSLVEVKVEPKEANKGFSASLRSALAGPTRYVATVEVRNITTEPLPRLALSGSVGHWLDQDAAVLELESPQVLEPGQTFSQEVVAEVSAPSIGGYTFDVTASGAGSAVTGTNKKSHHPLLFYPLAAILVLDLVVMIGRWLAKQFESARTRRSATLPTRSAPTTS